jgi:ClpP class serine protease
VDEDSIQSKLAAVTDQLADASKTIAKLEESQAKMVREAKLKDILSPLSGKKREQMEFVLANVETSRLDEAYKHFIGRVLKEEQVQETKPGATTEVLVESKNVVVTGEETASAEAAKPDTAKSAQFAHMRKLAGM